MLPPPTESRAVAGLEEVSRGHHPCVTTTSPVPVSCWRVIALGACGPVRCGAAVAHSSPTPSSPIQSGIAPTLPPITPTVVHEYPSVWAYVAVVLVTVACTVAACVLVARIRQHATHPTSKRRQA